MSWLKKTSLFKKNKEASEEEAAKSEEANKDATDAPDGGAEGEENAEENLNNNEAAGAPSTPEPRNGTAGSVRSRIQPNSFQPTLEEENSVSVFKFRRPRIALQGC